MAATVMPRFTVNWGIVFGAALAAAGAAIMAFVFAPLMSPGGVDSTTAFITALVFLLLVVAAAYALKK
jgi:ABC-type cobalamin transport system permease subunit